MGSERVDTADLLTKSDKELLAIIDKIRNNIVSYVSIERIIDELRGIINESECYAFKNKRSSKFISTKAPLFVLEANLEVIAKKYNHKFLPLSGYNPMAPTPYKADFDVLNRAIQDEITSKYSQFITTLLSDDEEFGKILANAGITGEQLLSKSDSVIMTFVVASIFGTNIELMNNIVYLEYAIRG